MCGTRAGPGAAGCLRVSDVPEERELRPAGSDQNLTDRAVGDVAAGFVDDPDIVVGHGPAGRPRPQVVHRSRGHVAELGAGVGLPKGDTESFLEVVNEPGEVLAHRTPW